MNNADLALDFLKKMQECRSKGVPNDMAALAALQDIADYKDKEWNEKLQKVNEKKFEEYVKRYAGVLGSDANVDLILATAKEMLSKLSLDFNEEQWT